MFQSLGDLNEPYSCDDWGNQAISGIPLIIDDTGLPVFGMFHTENLLPSSVFINHTMTVQYKYAGHDGEVAINEKIQDMLSPLKAWCYPRGRLQEPSITLTCWILGCKVQ